MDERRRGLRSGRGRDRETGARARGRGLFDPLRFGRAMVRRGVRMAILTVLLERPMHGYQVIQELEVRSGGRWRPSAGSVYPTLQQLEDEGLVKGEELEGRKVYTLTAIGRDAAAESPMTKHPWFAPNAGKESAHLRHTVAKLAIAAIQVERAGSATARAQAREILVDARRRLYQLLAEDDQESPDDGVAVDAGAHEQGGAA